MLELISSYCDIKRWESHVLCNSLVILRALKFNANSAKTVIIPITCDYCEEKEYDQWICSVCRSTTDCSFNHWFKLYKFVGKLVILSINSREIYLRFYKYCSKLIRHSCRFSNFAVVGLSYYGKSNLKSH